MIWESKYWKNDLIKIACKLELRRKQKRYPESSLVNLEKEVFIAFYAIRKLIEAKKLSFQIENLKVPVTCFPVKENLVVTRLNKGNLDKLYDFDKGKSKILDIKFVCNQIIHSYIFAPSFGEDGKLNGIAFCSDRKRNEEVYQIDITEITKLLNSVGSDYPDKGVYTCDSNRKDYKVDNYKVNKLDYD